ARGAAEERDRALAEQRADEPALAHRPDAVRQRPHLALALARMRVHARAGRPPLSVDPELRLLSVEAEQGKLLEARLEPERAKRVGDRLRRARRGIGTALPDADLDREGLDE